MRKVRKHTAEFKSAAVRRMQKGESPSALANELRVRRKLLYEWRGAVLAGRPLLTAGRPKNRATTPARGEGTVGRLKELERLLGQVSAENRFFELALQRIKELRQPNKKAGAAASSRASTR